MVSQTTKMVNYANNESSFDLEITHGVEACPQ